MTNIYQRYSVVIFDIYLRYIYDVFVIYLSERETGDVREENRSTYQDKKRVNSSKEAHTCSRQP